MNSQPDAEAVAQFLQQHPDFFDHYPDIVAELRLTTALGGRTVSLQERQVEILRDKVRQLELKLAAFMRNASGNELIMANLHQWTLQLLSDADPARRPASWLVPFDHALMCRKPPCDFGTRKPNFQMKTLLSMTTRHAASRIRTAPRCAAH